MNSDEPTQRSTWDSWVVGHRTALSSVEAVDVGGGNDESGGRVDRLRERRGHGCRCLTRRRLRILGRVDGSRSSSRYRSSYPRRRIRWFGRAVAAKRPRILRGGVRGVGARRGHGADQLAQQRRRGRLRRKRLKSGRRRGARRPSAPRSPCVAVVGHDFGRYDAGEHRRAVRNRRHAHHAAERRHGMVDVARGIRRDSRRHRGRSLGDDLYLRDDGFPQGRAPTPGHERRVPGD